jgi:hypothetical protein
MSYPVPGRIKERYLQHTEIPWTFRGELGVEVSGCVLSTPGSSPADRSFFEAFSSEVTPSSSLFGVFSGISDIAFWYLRLIEGRFSTVEQDIIVKIWV